MITEDLIAYIQAQLRKNTPKDLIASRLRKAGWHELDIEEGLRKVAPPLPLPQSPQRIEIQPIEIQNPPSIVQEARKEPQQYSAPSQVVSVANPEIPAKRPKPVTYVIPPKVKEPIVIESPISLPTNQLRNEPVAVKVEEVLPTLIPKVSAEPVVVPNPVSTINSLPKSALISSYAGDISVANITHETIQEQKRKRPIKWLLIILAISVVSGTVLALTSGRLPFVKKDPRVLLLRAPIAFGMQNSYKSKTTASLSLPSFANITSGLVTGEAVVSPDRDSISMVTDGLVNQSSGGSISLSYHSVFESSIWKDSIVTDLKYDGVTSYLSIPNLSMILGANAPQAQVVSIEKGKFALLAPLLPSYVSNKINMIDIEKMLSKGLAPYANTETGLAFKEFINTADIIEKSEEDINGAPTYHYQINADREATKRLINSLAGFFLASFSEDTQKGIEEGLGAVTLDTFEVWIGKKDTNIHRYKFVLSVPLSKVIGLDDKGIAGNKVTLEWASTFYDFRTKNNISMPKETIRVQDFMKKIDDMKIENAVLPLKSITSNLFNAEGSFGKSSNPSGSCINPDPGSLFSPLDHPKGASTPVGNIASAMNVILAITNGAGLCYSTPNAWAVSFPLQSDSSSYLCADSTGAQAISRNPITSTVCK